jgi:hypothetical protein
MVNYEQWISAVHTAYKQQGGTYQQDTASRLVQLAAEFWQQNKEELLGLAFDAAVRVAKRSLKL